jgi:hypothetical protein
MQINAGKDKKAEKMKKFTHPNNDTLYPELELITERPKAAKELSNA